MRQQFRSGELRFHGELCSQRENTPDGGRNDQRLLQVDGTSGSRRLDTNLCTRDTQEADLSSLGDFTSKAERLSKLLLRRFFVQVVEEYRRKLLSINSYLPVAIRFKNLRNSFTVPCRRTQSTEE